MLDDRKLAVLRAIVEDYVKTHEPVGSKALVERHSLGVSPATIRNDMAVLEEEGYIAQPHTSAGRVPTDRGYRLFVDRLSAIKPLNPAERRAIESFLAGAVDLDDVMSRTVRLLSQLTRQVAVVQYPSLSTAVLRHVELLPLSERRLLLVVITGNARVEQRVVDLPVPLPDQDLTWLRNRLNELLVGVRTHEVPQVCARLPESVDPAIEPAVTSVLSTLCETVMTGHDERIVLGGTANLARYVDGFGTIAPVLEALEEQMVLLRLLGETGAEAVSVRIGRENSVEGLTATSIVTAGYGPAANTLARLGVVGPTHMDYPSTIASVRAVARYLGHMLGSD